MTWLVQRTSASTLDGYALELSWDSGRGTRFTEYFTELREFGETMSYWFLTVKGDRRVLRKLYDPIRAKGTEVLGVRPVAMPVTEASTLAIFLWPQDVVDKTAGIDFLGIFSQTVSEVEVGKLPRVYSARETLRSQKRRENIQTLGALMLIGIVTYLAYVLLHALGIV